VEETDERRAHDRSRDAAASRFDFLDGDRQDGRQNAAGTLWLQTEKQQSVNFLGSS
jgi:hypothetical protein